MAHIVTHPDNVDLLRRKIGQSLDFKTKGQSLDDLWGSPPSLCGITIKTNPHMERDKPSGKYRVIPTGKVLAKDAFRLQEGRFIEYGPEDIPYLLMRGVIEELRDPLFLQISDAMERFRATAYLDVGFGFANRAAFLHNNFA